jgi:hypothetical protein
MLGIGKDTGTDEENVGTPAIEPPAQARDPCLFGDI